jgi:uncharacterized protein (DUF1501 family)
MLDMGLRTVGCCQGLSRRSLLRAGVLGGAGLMLPDLLRADEARRNAGKSGPSDRSIILVWLDGGPPQHETYDPKPDAPVEYRGPLKAIRTAIPGVALPELMPEHARLLDKISLVRSVHHNNGDHFAAAHWMLTGYKGANAADLNAHNPSAGSIVAKLRGSRRAGMPAYVGLPNTHSVGLSPGYHGGAYLGVAYNPFSVQGDPSSKSYRVPNLALPAGLDAARLERRKALLSAFDNARRDIDQSGLMDGLDRFSREAFAMISGPEARAAFDVSNEDPRLRDRYGRNRWGQSALLGRRLIEAGVRFVTLNFDGWDMHSSLDKSVHRAVPMLDSAVATLIDDLDQRGLLDSTMVVVMGEFGRGPRINKGLPQDPIPGRDHWGEVMSVLMTGGGLARGRVVGSSSARGETPKDRPLRPMDVWATVYHQLGIDLDTSFRNPAGRPISIGGDGQVIAELV